MQTCRICGNAQKNQTLTLKNVRQNLSETFGYYQCASCGCIQIEKIPSNLDDYYDNSAYYSFSAGVENGEKLSFYKKLRRAARLNRSRENRQQKEKPIAEYLKITPTGTVFEMESVGILVGNAQN